MYKYGEVILCRRNKGLIHLIGFIIMLFVVSTIINMCENYQKEKRIEQHRSMLNELRNVSKYYKGEEE